MKIKKLTALSLAGLFLFSCERPSSPDFEIQQSFEIPLIKSVTYTLMGEGSGAIIDTTSEDFEDLFAVDPDGLIRLSSEIEFDFGDFDNVLPSIDVDPTEVESEIGLLDVDDFSSAFESSIGDIENDSEEFDPEDAEIGVFEVEFDGAGRADYQKVTGLDPGLISMGDPIDSPAEPVVVYIGLDAGDFQNAVIDEGGIRFRFENNLGFDLSSLQATLLYLYDEDTEAGIPVGESLDFGVVGHMQSSEQVLLLSAGDELEVDLAVRVEINWNDQDMASAPGDLLVDARDENMKVRRATANIREQELTPDTEDLTISNEQFEYAMVADDPGEDELFQLIIRIENLTRLPVTNAQRSGLPEILIRNADGEILDQVRVFEHVDAPPGPALEQNQTGQAVINLAGQKLTRGLSYELNVGTPGGIALTVDRDDLFRISTQTSFLRFTEARSDVDPQQNIELSDTKEVDGDFVDAEVETGEMRLVFTNQSEIPLLIDHLRFFNDRGFVAKNTGRYFAQGTEIGSISNVVVPPLGSATGIIPLDGVGISNRVAYEGTASSPGTPEAVTVLASDLILTSMDGSVQLRSASSVLEPQHFTTRGEVEISEDDLKMTRENHFVEISSGMLRIRDINNEIDLDIDSLIISFPNIRIDPEGNGLFSPADSLVFEFSGPNRILRRANAQNGQPTIQQSLENVRIYAQDNKVIYHVRAVTENTRLAAHQDTVRVVNATDRFLATVDIENLNIRTAFGDIQTRVELINNDQGDDGVVDLFDDEEAEITEIEDLDLLSDRLSGLNLFHPGFDLIYDTNLGVPGTLVAAILGINSDGEEVYLSGKPGTSMEVLPGDDFQNLFSRGVQIDRTDLIRFDIEPVSRIGDMDRGKVVRFDTDKTNVDVFLSNLPVEVRLVGKVITNPDETEGFIVDPIEFQTSMGIDIPLNMSTSKGEPASIRDTISADLSDLPSPEDDLQLKEMILHIAYENGLPFKAGLTLEFLDEMDMPVLTQDGSPIAPVQFGLEGAGVDAQTRFVSSARAGFAEIRLSGEQLDQISQTRKVRLNGSLETSREADSGEIKLRTSDFIKLSVTASFTTSIRVD